MSLTSEFELVWEPFHEKLLSEVLDSTGKNTLPNLDDINAFYTRMLRMWEDPARVQCGFLKKWGHEYPGLEEDLLEVLHDFRFQQVGADKKQSSAAVVGGALAAAAAGGCIGGVLPETNVLKAVLGNVPTILIGAAVFSMIGGSIAQAVHSNAVHRAGKEAVDLYKMQLFSLHSNLCNVLKQYEQ